jgi:uncharacterized protein YneF (UPF0154 family)
VVRILEVIMVLALIAVIITPFINRRVVRKHMLKIMAGLLVFITFLLPFHQYFAHHFWFHQQGFWNHEALEACAITLAVGLFLGKYLGRRQDREK